MFVGGEDSVETQTRLMRKQRKTPLKKKNNPFVCSFLKVKQCEVETIRIVAKMHLRTSPSECTFVHRITFSRLPFHACGQ